MHSIAATSNSICCAHLAVARIVACLLALVADDVCQAAAGLALARLATAAATAAVAAATATKATATAAVAAATAAAAAVAEPDCLGWLTILAGTQLPALVARAALAAAVCTLCNSRLTSNLQVKWACMID
jgi:hypothetical protein